MKNARIAGAVALVLAVLVAVLGALNATSRPGEGAFGGILQRAQEVQAQMDGNAQAVRNVASAGRKAENATSGVTAAAEKAAEAQAAAEELAGLVEAGETGESRLDLLLEVLSSASVDGEAAEAAFEELEAAIPTVLRSNERARAAVDEMRGALDDVQGVTGEVQSVVDGMVSDLFVAALSPAQEAVIQAEEAINSALDSADTIYAALGGDEQAPERVSVTEPEEAFTPESAIAAADAYAARAAELEPLAADAAGAVQAATEAAQAASQAVRLSFMERVVTAMQANKVALFFTVGLLVVIAAVLLCFARPFFALWKRNPVFPVFVVLLGMLVFQIYALGFDQPTFADWFAFWGNNLLNVLRANISVGMIALGMTLVIITGGIDLAVGSTLAGIGTVMMVLMDTSSAGVLTRMGITGVPLYIIGILGGMLTGLILGTLTGVAITKGGVPPFIVTLGTMNIVRSVAQYFTKSYSPKIPDGFSAISNTVIGGQRLLPILYWVIMAVAIYVLSKHTAFGRHVYAVGSNERTTRLSGINVDRVKIKVYALMGLIVSIATVVQLARLGSMDVASAGSGFEMDAIAAAVVGGTSMAGGKGSVIGTVLGVLIIGLMNNLLILLGVDPFLTNAFKGAIVLLAVLMQRKEKEA